MFVLFWYLVQCTLLYQPTMDKSFYTRYQKHTAMYNYRLNSLNLLDNSYYYFCLVFTPKKVPTTPAPKKFVPLGIERRINKKEKEILTPEYFLKDLTIRKEKF